MFDRDRFIAYVGAKSGTTYAADVDNIEKLYGKDVDAEYEKDHCVSLLDEPKCFLMKPDIVITRKMNGAIFILDTKWKLLPDAKANYGISQTDMYQMYAYQKKYGAECVTLLYPMTNQVPLEKQISYKSEDGTKVRVGFVDLFHVRESLSNLMCMQGGETD
jgi:5-methylcytosine-specific restriction enzyme subunit McrC